MSRSATGAAERLTSVRRDVARGALAATAIGVFVNVLQLTVPLYSLQIYDRVISSRSLDTLAVLTALTLGLVAFLGFLDHARGRLFAITAERLVGLLDGPALGAAVRARLRGEAAAGEVLRDLEELRRFVAHGPVALPLDLALAPLFLIVLALLHPAYGVVGLCAAVGLTVFAAIVDVAVRRPARPAEERDRSARLDAAAAVRHAEVIEALGMLEAVARRWRRARRSAAVQLDRNQALGRAAAATARALRVAVQVAVLATGATLAIEHAATVGTICAAAILMGRALFPFEQLVEGWRQWAGALTTWRRLEGTFRAHDAERSTVPLPITSGALLFDRVGFVPPGAERPALRNLSFAVGPGEILGVVGPSGAGKSTLARLICGVWRPGTGTILLDGHDVFAAERASFGRAVGYLPQDPCLLDGTVRDNIARFSDADPAEVVAAARAAGVHELVGRLPLGYETRLGDGGFSLSGGQRQRIALARALFGGPHLLVLDEPNANLDAEGEQALIRAVEAARQAGTAVVVVAQRVSVLAVADTLLVLRDGAVAQHGPRDAVMRELTEQAMAGRGDGKVTRLPVAGRRVVSA